MFPLLNADFKRYYLDLLLKVFAIIVGISLLFYIAWINGVHLPSTPLENDNSFYDTFQNYYFFISSGDYGPLNRFSSIFTEPGHLGMICSILLYVNGYTWKDWRNIIMTIALIWSFSLAGYMLYLFGIIVYQITTNRNVARLIKNMILSILGIIVLVSAVNLINSDIIETKILDRLELDSEKGISGNNRNTKYFDLAYDNLEPYDLILGLPPATLIAKGYSVGNSSYKNFIMQDGYLGLLLLTICLALYAKSFPSKRGYGLLALLALSFLQRPYILWEMESLTYFAALTYFHLSPTKNIVSS
jgi:hypothetical protein